MDANMNLKESNDRGRLWPLLFTILGAVNVFDFFYKSAHQTSDLLQGIGFLLVVPLLPTTPPLAATAPPKACPSRTRDWGKS